MTTIHTETELDWPGGYWIGHCEGFRVEDEGRRLGFVEAVVGDECEPEGLLVRGGLFANRLYMVPVTDVERVDPHAERITLRAGRGPCT